MGPVGANRPGPAGSSGRSPTTPDAPVLVVDVGSTTTSLALASPAGIRARTCRTTARWPATAGGTLARLAAAVGVEVDPAAIGGLAFASVVPAATAALRRATRGAAAPVVEVGVGTWPMPVGYDDPAQVGADRIANALGAADRYGTPVVVVDLGTATTVEAVSADGVLVGGAIAPGVGVGLDALLARAPHLPRIDLSAAAGAGEAGVATSTATALRAGVLRGAGALVDRLVADAQRAVGRCPVVATGAGAALAANWSRRVTVVDADVTLWGVYRAFRAEQAGPADLP